MNYFKYSNYKDSGIEWLGKIPIHWDIRKLKFLATIQLSNVDKHTIEGEKKVFLCNYVDVYKNEKITNTLEFMLASASDEQIRKLTLSAKDVIITKDSETPDDIGVPAFVPENLFSIVCGYHLALIRPFSNYLLGEYLFRVFQSSSTKAYFSISAVGVTRFGLGKDAIFNTAITLPSLKEQRAIANFLDRETSRLDKLIAAKERLLVLLGEKRRLLITQAMTRGLDPDVEMRDSGVEWLGEIPAHWRLVRLKFLVSKIGSGKTPLGGADTYVSKGIPLIRSQNVRFEGLSQDDLVFIDEETDKQMANSRTFSGDVLLNITGASIGRCCLVPKSLYQANVNQHVCVIRPLIKLINNEFLKLFIESEIGQAQVFLSEQGISREGLTFEEIGNFVLLLPLLEEQHKIIAYIETETKKLDLLKAVTERTISLLKERRTSLIAAAVAGQIAIEGTNDYQTTAYNQSPCFSQSRV